jgi:hypothetical protein
MRTAAAVLTIPMLTGMRCVILCVQERKLFTELEGF